MKRHELKKGDDVASYCCEAAGSVPAEGLLKEDAFARHELKKGDDAASYCCEAAGSVPAEDLPKEDAFK